MVSFSHINLAASAGAAAKPAADESSKVEKGNPVLRIDASTVSNFGQAEAAEQSADSGDSTTVTQLKALIKDLQKRLAEEQKQLALINAQSMEESAKRAAVAGKQTSIAALSEALMTASAQLLVALTASGASGAGNLLSARV